MNSHSERLYFCLPYMKKTSFFEHDFFSFDLMSEGFT